jgi:DNA-binding MarR family transcriptional regulator
MIHEGLLSERKAPSGRALLVQLTAKGNKYREYLINERRAVDEKLRKKLNPEEIATLVRLLKVVAELEI